MTADSLTIAYAFLFIAIVLRLALVSGSARQSAWIVALAACAGALTLAKLAYAPMVLLVLICPSAQFRDPRRHRAVVLATLGLSALAAIAWLVAVRDLYVPQSIAPDADPARQVSFILGHRCSTPRFFTPICAATLAAGVRLFGMQATSHGGSGGAYRRPRRRRAARLRPAPTAEWRAKRLLWPLRGQLRARQHLQLPRLERGGALRIGFIQGRYYLPLPRCLLLLSNGASRRRFPAAADAWSGWFAIGVALITLYGLARRWYGL